MASIVENNLWDLQKIVRAEASGRPILFKRLPAESISGREQKPVGASAVRHSGAAVYVPAGGPERMGDHGEGGAPRSQ